MSYTYRQAMRSVKSLQEKLLNWYDENHRVLPWRAARGQRPDPYHVWLSEIMLQQTTVATVGAYFEKFIQRWPTIQSLAQADLDEVLTAWAGLGYYARARNLYKCAQIIAQERGGVFPQDLKDLQSLPGIGPYTAAAIASIAFDREASAVDGNVERVVARYFKIETPLPAAKVEMREKAALLVKEVSRPGDFTQALMELGATVCTPRQPKCDRCPWRKMCRGLKAGIAQDLPKPAPAVQKPVRYGVALLHVRKDGRFLIRRRPEKGLLGGMYEIPSTPWVENPKALNKLPPEISADIIKADTVRHTFTHFHLHLAVAVIKAKLPVRAGETWVNLEQMTKFALPTVMRKVVNLAVKQNLGLK